MALVAPRMVVVIKVVAKVVIKAVGGWEVLHPMALHHPWEEVHHLWEEGK